MQAKQRKKQNVFSFNVHLKHRQSLSHKMESWVVCYQSAFWVTWVHPVSHCVNVKPHPTFWWRRSWLCQSVKGKLRGHWRLGFASWCHFPSLFVEPACPPRFPQLTWMLHWISHTCEEADIPASNKCFPTLTLAWALSAAFHLWLSPLWLCLSDVLPDSSSQDCILLKKTLMYAHLKVSLWCSILVQTWFKPFLNTGFSSPTFNYKVWLRPRHNVEAKHHVRQAYNSREHQNQRKLGHSERKMWYSNK